MRSTASPEDPHSEWSNQLLAQHVATTDRIVRKWCRRWTETQSLSDAPRPGAPPTRLSVTDGQVTGLGTISKRFADFQTFIQTVLVPHAQRRGIHTIVLIVDNETTHAPKQIVG